MRACSVTQFTVSDSATLWTVAHQAPLSMGFPRQEYWSGKKKKKEEEWAATSSSGDLSDPGIEPMSPALQAHSLPLHHLGSPRSDN